MMTGWLPVYHHLNKMESTQQTCPYCQNDETIAHLFQCKDRQKWRTQFFKKLEEFFNQTRTTHQFRTNLRHHLEYIFIKQHDTQHFKQFTLFAGLIPTDWKFQAINISTNNTPILNLQRQWAMKMSAWLSQQGHELWLLRNAQIYDNDKTTTQMGRVLNTKIRQLYALQDSIGYHDRRMFSQPIEERLSLHETQKMTWIAQTTKTLKVSTEEYETKQTTGQRDIRQFFSYTDSNRK